LPQVAEDIPPLPDAVADFKKALAEVREAEERRRGILTTEMWLKRASLPNA
jgi:type I restriction enzyme M protein